MTSSMTPSALRASPGPSFERRNSRGWPAGVARSASRTTTGWAQLPPTQPSIVPSGWMIPEAPGRAEVGFRPPRTVAPANGRSPASSAAARAWVEVEPVKPALRCPSRPSGDALLVEDRPDLLGRDRDVDVADAEVPQRVDDGVGDRRRGTDGSRLPDALRPDRVMGRRGDGLLELPGGRLDGRRQEVVHERAGQVVAELVVRDLLVEGRRKAHRQAAVDLAVDDHRVDDVPAVVDGDESADLDLAGALVEIDHADVRAEGEGQVRRVVVVDRLEPGLHPGGMVRVG